MRYTKIALLTFGAGLALGLLVVVIEFDWLDRVASSLMALGLAAVPLGMIVDWRLATRPSRRPPQRRRNRPAPAARVARRNPRPRKPPAPKR